jgi:hypothetical protein
MIAHPGLFTYHLGEIKAVNRVALKYNVAVPLVVYLRAREPVTKWVYNGCSAQIEHLIKLLLQRCI